MMPKHVKDDEIRDKVMILAANGTAVHDIAAAVGLDVTTVRKHYDKELKTGRAVVHGEVAGYIIQKVRQGDTRMMEFYAKTQMGYSETKRISLSTPAATLLIVESILKAIPPEYHERVKLATLTALNDAAAAERAALPESVSLADFEDVS